MEKTKRQNGVETGGRWSFRTLNLSDDFLFSKVMGDPEVCRVTLEKILGIPIIKTTIPTTEHVIDMFHDSKGIRLDVYVADEKGDVYNVEMQTGAGGELPRRSRYYHSCIDLDLLGKGDRYKALTKAFVIFICTFDPFGQGRHVYSFRNVCDELPGLFLGDDSYTIFLSTKGTADDVSDEMKEFLAYVEDSSDAFAAGADSDWVRQVHDRVRKLKENRDLEAEYMKTYLTYQDKLDEGMEMIAQLHGYLLENDMLDELRRSIMDADYRRELLHQYQTDGYIAV